MQQTHETSSAVNCYWPARAMQQTHETSSAISILPWLIVIGQQEQCSKYMKPLECNIKPTMVNCYWPTRAMQQTHET